MKPVKWLATAGFIAGTAMLFVPPLTPIGLVVMGASGLTLGWRQVYNAIRDADKPEKQWKNLSGGQKAMRVLKFAAAAAAIAGGPVGWAIGGAMLAGNALGEEAVAAVKYIGSKFSSNKKSSQPPMHSPSHEIPPAYSRDNPREPQQAQQMDSPEPSKNKKNKLNVLTKKLENNLYKIVNQDDQHTYFKKFSQSTLGKLSPFSNKPIKLKNENCPELQNISEIDRLITPIQIVKEKDRFVAQKATPEFIDKIMSKNIEPKKNVEQEKGRTR